MGFLDHTQTDRQTHTYTQNGYDSSGRGIGPPQTPLPDTQQSQKTNIHAPGVIRTRNPNKRAAADPRLRPRCHWDRLSSLYPKVTNKYRPIVGNTSYDALNWQLSVIFHYYSLSRYKYYPENSSTNSPL